MNFGTMVSAIVVGGLLLFFGPAIFVAILTVVAFIIGKIALLLGF